MTKKTTQGSKSSEANAKVKVLYQNLNGVWYAFAQLGDNVFFGRVPLQASPGDKKLEAEISKKLRSDSNT